MCVCVKFYLCVFAQSLCQDHTVRSRPLTLFCVLRSCDYNRNKKVTLTEWTSCLVDRSEAWFYRFMCQLPTICTQHTHTHAESLKIKTT